MPIKSLDRAFKEEAEQLTRQVIVAQFFGSLLLVLPALWLPSNFKIYGRIWALAVLVYTAGFGIFWQRDRLLGRPAISPMLRLNQIRNSLIFIVSLDSAVILLAIGQTGGITQSHLTGVLLLIPCVMAIVAVRPLHFLRISLGLVCVICAIAGSFFLTVPLRTTSST